MKETKKGAVSDSRGHYDDIIDGYDVCPGAKIANYSVKPLKIRKVSRPVVGRSWRADGDWRTRACMR